MRLLHFDETGEVQLTKDLIGDDFVPPYAILSHTWGADDEEVTFEDITHGDGPSKPGFEKIRFCGEQSRRDGLQYFWVDTCAINKGHASEVTESVNSMFRWYRNASKCYVFLSDVSASLSGHDFNFQLRNSRYFTRGWTLQEIVAPQQVEFFSRTRERLGDKRSLEKQLHEITGISISALRGESLSHFTIDERMAWAANRTTRRPEDKVYSLFGIFDIHMETIYGEGEHHAYRRLLRELERHLETSQLSERVRQGFQSPTRTELNHPAVDHTEKVPFKQSPSFTGCDDAEPGGTNVPRDEKHKMTTPGQDETTLSGSTTSMESLKAIPTRSPSPQSQLGIMTPDESLMSESTTERLQASHNLNPENNQRQPFELKTHSSAEAWISTFRSERQNGN